MIYQKKYSRCKCHRGYTLIEILLSVGLAFVLAAAMAVAFSNFSLNNKQNKLRLARQNLFLELKNQIAKPRLLHWSSTQAGNEDLLKCTAPPPVPPATTSDFNAADCWALSQEDHPRPLILYNLNSTDKIAEGGDIKNPIAAEINKGVRYTVDGAKCPAGSTNCPIIVRVFFKPVCRVQGYTIGGYTIDQESRCKKTTDALASHEAPKASNQIYDIQIHFRISADIANEENFPFKTLTSLKSTVTIFGATNATPISPLVINAARIGDPTSY